jgi:hypothetical protein
MDTASQHLYDYMIGRSQQGRQMNTYTIGGRDGSSVRRDHLEGMTYTKGERGEEGYYSGGGTTISESTYNQAQQSFQAADVKAQQAQKSSRQALYKWMAEYNKNLNIHERIALSEKRQKYRQRFADMQIQAERTQAKRTRDVLKTGTTGLTTGAGTGLSIPV